MISETDIQGHWVREWIKAPGFEDHETRVHWMQAGCDYADVRIPLKRPDLKGADCLADLPASALRALAEAEGFAGGVTLEGAHCTWHREINWHGTPDGADVGAISFDETGRMIERGVLADYTELWVQKAEAVPRVLRFGNRDYSGHLVLSGETAVLGIGRVSKASTAPLLRALEEGRRPQGIETLFDGIHALCRVEGKRLIARLATDPFAEGQTLLTLEGDTAVWHQRSFTGVRHEITLAMETAPA